MSVSRTHHKNLHGKLELPYSTSELSSLCPPVFLGCPNKQRFHMEIFQISELRILKEHCQGSGRYINIHEWVPNLMLMLCSVLLPCLHRNKITITTIK